MNKPLSKHLKVVIFILFATLATSIIRFTKNRFTPTISEGLVEAKAKLRVGENALLTPVQRTEAIQRLTREIYDAIRVCETMIDEKLFFFDIWFEQRRGKSKPWVSREAFQKTLYTRVIQPDLIDLYAHTDAISFFSQTVSCAYDPTTHSATGMKYPEGLNISGHYKSYQSKP